MDTKAHITSRKLFLGKCADLKSDSTAKYVADNYATKGHTHSGLGGGTTIVDTSGNIQNYKIAYATVNIDTNNTSYDDKGRPGTVSFNSHVICAVAVGYFNNGLAGSCATYVSWKDNKVTVIADNDTKNWFTQAIVIAIVQ